MNQLAQRILVRLILGGLFIVVLFTLISYARGYRFNFSQQSLDSTGIIVASSFPDGAKIYLNGELFGATNENITIEPGEYAVEIKKDGFSTWSKILKVKGELVIKIDALLFPRNPSLSPVTSLGLVHAETSPSKEKVVLMSQTGDVERDGIYTLEGSLNPLSSISQVRLVVAKSAFPELTDLSQSDVTFSPDESEAIVTIRSFAPSPEEGSDASSEESAEGAILGIYLLDLNETVKTPFNITRSVGTVQEAWEKEATKLYERKIQTFKKPLPSIIASSFDVITFSPNDEKILYRAAETITLPIIIKPQLIAANQTPETRTITKGDIYVYDSDEDKNFHLFSAEEVKNFTAFTEDEIWRWLFWYPDSGHLVMMRPDEEGNPSRIAVADYDGTNIADVYTGPFEDNFLSITHDGRLLVLTNLNARSGALPDVYTVGIR